MMDDYGSSMESHLRELEGHGRAIDDLRTQIQRQDRDIAMISITLEIYTKRIDHMSEDVAIIKEAVVTARGGRQFGAKMASVAAAVSGAAAAVWIFLTSGGSGQ